MPLNIETIRAATPGCEESAFLLSAGSSLPTQATLRAVVDHLELESRVGGYAAADAVAPVLQHARASLATLIGGQSCEVALAISDSAAWIKAWWGWCLGGNVAKGSVVLIDRLSYHSHYAALVQTQTVFGFAIEVFASHPDGTVDLDHAVIAANVSVICLTMIGTHCGNVNPVADIARLAAAQSVPVFVDGCQALGHMQVNVRDLGIQVFTGTGRKYLRAPRGTGVLWVASELIERFQPPGIDGTSSSWDPANGITVHPGMARFEEYENSIAAQVGLANAAGEAVALGMANIEPAVIDLADHLRAELSESPGVTVQDTAIKRCGIVTFTVNEIEPAEVVAAAKLANVVINASNANWASLDMQAKGFNQVVRAAPHYFNTVDEIDSLVSVVRNLR